MKFLCERDKLHDALSFVGARAKNTLKIPILQHIRFDAANDRLTLTGHDLDSSSQIIMAAEVSDAGEITIPSEGITRLVAGAPKGSQILIHIDGERAKIRAGRSNYVLPTLPVEDFPNMLVAKDAQIIALKGEQISEIFERPSPIACTEQARIYLQGVYFHCIGKKLSGCATDGHRLMRTIVDAPASKFEPIIVPTAACKEFAKIAGDGECELAVSKTLVSLSIGDKVFTSKLIDGSFPDYERVIPKNEAKALSFEVADIAAALSRLEAITDPESKQQPVVSLSWDANPDSARLNVQNTYGEGEEIISCEGDGNEAGTVAFQLSYLRGLLDALDCERCSIFVNSPQEAIRITNPMSAGVTAVLMPCRA